MNVTSRWLSATGAEFSPGEGRPGCAHLSHYTANYCEWGDGPPIVLIPGLAGGYELLGPGIRQLSQHFRVISYQLRGEDDSFVLRRPFQLQDLVKDLEEFLDWLVLENPILMGVSFGGIIGLEFASRRPYRVQNLILQGVGAKYEPGLIQRVAGMVLSRFPLPTDNPFVNQFYNLLFGGKQRNKSLFRFVTGQCWKTEQCVMAHRLKLVEQFDMESRLEQIQAPTLILSGNRDILVSKRSLRSLHNGLVDPTLVRLTGAGHLGFVTQPERVAKEVLQFVSQQAELEFAE